MVAVLSNKFLILWRNCHLNMGEAEMIAVRMVMFSAFDLDTYLPIARQALGHGVAARADAETSSPELHNILCIAGLIDGAPEDVESLYHLAYLIASDERDMGEIIQVAGMPHVYTDTATRGLQVALISGPAPLWGCAVRRGCSDRVSAEVRRVYNLVFNDLTSRSLDGIIGNTVKRSQGDETFYLERK